MRLPRTIGRYEFVELLGTGGSGAVYRAREHGPLGLTHDVAVKVLSSSYDRLGGRAAFSDEARMLARIAHPCVVPIRTFAVLEDDVLGELPVIVMHLVRGTKLSTLLRRCRKEGVLLPLPATLHLLLQLSDALEAVHQAVDEDGRPMQIVHRDLKPANLMVSPQGDLRVLDFGIAWAKERSAPTTQNVVKGTLRYLSPEQMVGETPDGRADLYAVGAVAFEMLVGEPYVNTPDGRDLTGAVLGALLRTRLVHRLPSLRTQLGEAHGLSPSEAEHVTDLLVRLLQTDRDKRFPHARALSAALDRLAEGRPLRRARRWLGAVVRGAPVGEQEGVVAPRRANPAEVAPRESEDAPPASTAWLPWAVAATLAALVAVGWFVHRSVGGAPAAQPVSLAVAPADDLPVAPEARPYTTLAHAPPLPQPGTGDRVFRVEVLGDGECIPRLLLRSVAGTPWVTRPMRGDGRHWELRLSAAELAGFAGGVEYWVRCGSAGAPLATWRSPDDPAQLSL